MGLVIVTLSCGLFLLLTLTMLLVVEWKKTTDFKDYTYSLGLNRNSLLINHLLIVLLLNQSVRDVRLCICYMNILSERQAGDNLLSLTV